MASVATPRDGQFADWAHLGIPIRILQFLFLPDDGFTPSNDRPGPADPPTQGSGPPPVRLAPGPGAFGRLVPYRPIERA